MNTQETVETVKVVEKSFATLRLKRNNGGCELYFKSSEIEKYFKNQHNGSIVKIDGDGGMYANKEAYRTTFNTIGEYDRINMFDSEASLFYGDKLNLSFIRAVGITEGQRFQVNFPYSTSKLQDFIDRAKQSLAQFYNQYLKELDIEIRIITR